QRAPAGIGSPDTPGENKPPLTRGAIELGLLGVGIAGITVGTIGAVSVASKNSHALEICPDHQCPTDGAYADSQSDHDGAATARTVSMIGFGVGAVALITDAVLFLTDSSRSRQSSKAARDLAIAPHIGPATVGG